MRIDLGLILGIALEFIFFMYYADSMFYRKKSALVCYGVVFLCYFIHFWGCTLGNISLNITIFTIINILGFWFCYHTKWQQAVLHGCLLVVLCLAGEWIVLFYPPIGIVLENGCFITPEQSMILTVVGKTVYLVGILLVRYLWNRNKNADVVPQKWILLISCTSVAVFVLLFQLQIHSVFLGIICVLIIAIDIFVLMMNKEVTAKSLEKDEKAKVQMEEAFLREEYELLQDKYEKISILHHDFKAHMQTLARLIDADNKEALAYMEAICEKEEDAGWFSYTDHDVLNMLLTKKKAECKAQGVHFTVEPFGGKLSFMENTDCVALFSNLLTNAMEGASHTQKKQIYLHFETKNENFLCIRAENSADMAPVIISGRLLTRKKNKNEHGIGMSSMQEVVKKYGGSMHWEYKEDEKVFRVVILLPVAEAK